MRIEIARRFRLGLCGFLALALAHASFSGEARERVFHVSPDGNDSWSGHRASPSLLRKDGPFRTVTRALDAARQQSGTRAVVLHSGTYFLKSPILLAPVDSGLRIQGDGVVQISGGVAIEGWFKTNFNGWLVFAARVTGPTFQELWVNGKRAVRARHPNAGYFEVNSVPDKTAGWQEGNSRFIYKGGDIGAWKELDPEAMLVVMNRWVESHLPIAGIDSPNRTISFSKRSVWQLAEGDPYYVEGVAEALDAPGEWFLDSRARVVYYMPCAGERIGKLNAVAPVLEQIVKIQGDPQKSELVSNVTFTNVIFSHTEWVYPSSRPGKLEGDGKLESGGAVQAAFTVPAAIEVVGARQVVFEGCRFEHFGTYGLSLGAGCQSNLVSRCEFRDLAAGGIKLGLPSLPAENELTANNEVVDCTIHDGGKVFHSAVGIWVGHSPSNRFLHNEICDFYYTGISIGWSWGYGPAAASNNLVAYNSVHHIGRKSDGDGPILSDMGGIYTLGLQPGTRILNNVWHDIAGHRYGGWGIYLDEGSTGILVASNVVYGTTHGGFHQHYGRENTLVNNIFALARDHQLQRTRAEEHISFFFRTNIVLIDKGVFLGGNWDGGKFVSDENLFFDTRPGGETNSTFATKTFETWRATGHDQSSVFADPELNFAAQNIPERIPAGPSATRVGFEKINVSGVGPRK